MFVCVVIDYVSSCKLFFLSQKNSKTFHVYYHSWVSLVQWLQQWYKISSPTCILTFCNVTLLFLPLWVGVDFPTLHLGYDMFWPVECGRRHSVPFQILKLNWPYTFFFSLSLSFSLYIYIYISIWNENKQSTGRWGSACGGTNFSWSSWS
jgi:hypothetical protein